MKQGKGRNLWPDGKVFEEYWKNNKRIKGKRLQTHSQKIIEEEEIKAHVSEEKKEYTIETISVIANYGFSLMQKLVENASQIQTERETIKEILRNQKKSQINLFKKTQDLSSRRYFKTR